MDHASVDLAPVAQLLLLVAVLASAVLALWWWRHRDAGVARKLRALAALTLFLTFDLIVFGSFTRLTDSGLGCPDWPGCYGQASPIGATLQIGIAEGARPTGPVTHTKAWIEMIHRYLAATVGALVVVMAAAAWRHRKRLAHSLAWPLVTLVWVLVQGALGKYTVTLKLYPAVVTMHLLGGIVLLALLVVQFEAWRNKPQSYAPAWARAAVAALLGLVLLQVGLGGWVSSNYAVLACRGFPQCNGQWWPAMDVDSGFALLRQLGRTAGGEFVGFDALVAIAFVHRVFALVVALALGVSAWLLGRSGAPAQRRYAFVLMALLIAQVTSGASNVVLDWPIGAALAHSAGAAALAGLLCSWLARVRAAAAS
jgi:heme a synthase